MRTATFSIQVAVRAVNDPPVVIAPPTRTAVPGESTALPGFVVRDPDTDTDDRTSIPMIKVSKRRELASEKTSTWSGARFGAMDTRTRAQALEGNMESMPCMTLEQLETIACMAQTAYLGCAGERRVLDGLFVTEEGGAVWRRVSRRIRQRPQEATSDRATGDII